jgi:hypothetical protein
LQFLFCRIYRSKQLLIGIRHNISMNRDILGYSVPYGADESRVLNRARHSCVHRRVTQSDGARQRYGPWPRRFGLQNRVMSRRPIESALRRDGKEGSAHGHAGAVTRFLRSPEPRRLRMPVRSVSHLPPVVPPAPAPIYTASSCLLPPPKPGFPSQHHSERALSSSLPLSHTHTHTHWPPQRKSSD